MNVKANPKLFSEGKLDVYKVESIKDELINCEGLPNETKLSFVLPTAF